MVLFDKTGTLTMGEPEVCDVVSLDHRFSADEVLGLAAASEIRLRHPAASSTRAPRPTPRRNDSRSAKTPATRLARASPAAVNGYTVRVGSARFLEAADVSLAHVDGLGTRLAETGQSIIYVAVNQSLIGVIGYHDLRDRKQRRSFAG